MKFLPTGLDGAWLIEPERLEDALSSFTRTFCAREFAAHGLHTGWVQHNVSVNSQAGTLRGLHYQAAPHGEIKLVHCTRGRMFDVIADLRRDSPTFRQTFCTELGLTDARMLYIPLGFAHGFLTLEDDTEVTYCISAFYEPASVRGVRWNDPALAIPWPRAIRVMADRDANFPDIGDEGITY